MGHRWGYPPIGRWTDFVGGLEPVSRDWGYDRGLPIDRYYIERFLAGHAADIAGHVLEFGDDVYTVKFGGGRVTRGDVLAVVQGNSKATIVADLADAYYIPSDTFTNCSSRSEL